MKIQFLFRVAAPLALAAFWFGCKPHQDDDFSLTGDAVAPEFSIEMLAGPENRVVVKDLSTDNFQRVWDLPGAAPKTSTKAIDTVAYALAGTYTITLHVSKTGGTGTANGQKTVTFAKDAPLTCNPKLALLTGDCGTPGKCWTMSRAAGAVKVGPTYDDFSWFTSAADGLQAEQYDDNFCFTFDKLVYENRNNGASVDPWDGYKVIPFQPGKSTFTYLNGTGTLGRDQILLDNDAQFIGVWDCDNLLDVIKLTATELVVRGKQREKSGAPKAEGWFELTLMPR